MPPRRLPINNNPSGNNSNAIGPQVDNKGPNAPPLEFQQIIQPMLEEQRQANERQVKL